MVSIIVCSRHTQIPQKLKDNIADTIGNVLFDIVWIDNSNNQYNIFQAYNEGVRKSKGEYLCFMHEDILFRSSNWGQEAIKQIESEENVGILGVAGTQVLTTNSVGWINNDYMCGKWMDGYSKKRKMAIFESKYKTKDLVAVDGVWMFAKKVLFDVIAFDEETYNGFHYYDIDTCVQAVTRGFKVRLVENILIEHFSRGGFNEIFYENCALFHEKWNSKLPVSISSLNSMDILEAENTARRLLLKKSADYYTLSKKLIWWPYRIIDLLNKFFH